MTRARRKPWTVGQVLLVLFAVMAILGGSYVAATNYFDNRHQATPVPVISHSTAATPRPTSNALFRKLLKGKTWRAKGVTYTVAKDFTGTARFDLGPCDPATSDPLCYGKSEVTYAPKDTAVNGDTQPASFTDEHGQPPPAGFIAGDNATSVFHIIEFQPPVTGAVQIIYDGYEDQPGILCTPAAPASYRKRCNI